MKFKKKFLSGVLSIALVGSNLLISNANTQQLEVHHINVGQGESIYIELPDGSDMLIDAGKSNQGSTVVNYLKKQESNIDIEYLIASHPDADHVGGMSEVFKQLKVKNFTYPKDAPHTTQTWNNVLNLAKSEGCTIKDGTPGTAFNIGGATMKFVHSSKDFSDNNDDSIVTYLDYKNAEFLFTGDIESDAEADMVNKGLVPNIDFMSVPHHGSKGSSTKSFVTKADPEYAIVSVGNNSYGHPTADALNKYTNIGAKVYRTDKLGNIVIKTDGNNATINGNKVNIGGTSTSTPNSTTSLSDIKGHWAESSIKDFVSKGYVGGYSNGTFKPNNNITRAEFVVMVNNYFGLTKSSGKVFSDTKNHWAKTAIDIAVTNGVCNGKTATEFKPNDYITREQVAVMLSNYKKLTDKNHEEIYKFTDKAQISSYAKDSVEGVVERGYMSGYSDGNFKPNNKITRAEAVSTLSRVHKGAVPPVVNTAVPSTPSVKPPTNNNNTNNSTSNSGSASNNSTVYVTPSGKSYHKTKNCVTLKRSKTILSMTLSQAKSKGKSDPCNLCVR